MVFDFQSFWQRRGILNILLLPLSAIFAMMAALRRRYLLSQQKKYLSKNPGFPPVIIVGNVVVGGGGKTPIVIALAHQLAQCGHAPGIISRGYGGRRQQQTLMVTADSDWTLCGDEPLLIRQKTKMPVCVGDRRLAALRLAAAGCDVIISDDGLQHYILPRAMEICVVNADYRFGNGWYLPAGPLREGVKRIRQCALCLLIGQPPSAGGNENNAMVGVEQHIKGIYAHHGDQQLCETEFFKDKTVTAVAGIAHPQAFFQNIEKMGIKPSEKKSLPDHSITCLENINSDIILMSEKDAVKYPPTDGRCYVLAIEYKLPAAVMESITQCLRKQSA